MNWYLVWIIGFLILLFAVAVVSMRSVKTTDDYVMGNFNLGFFPICGSIVATVTGSAALIGGAGQGFEIGVNFMITKFGYVIFTIAAVLILGPVIRKLRLYTVPDLFSRRFGVLAALIPALIIGFLYMTPTFGMQLVGMSSILSSVTELPVSWGIVLAFFVTLAFTLGGGLPGVAWTDAIQSILILAGVALTLVFLFAELGGPAEVIDSAPPELLSFGSIGLKELLNWFLIFGPFYMVWQTTWQRIGAAKSAKVASSAVVSGILISALIAFFAVLIGVAATQEYPKGTDPDTIYTSAIVDIFPGAIGGLLMVSLLAALLTGATSFLLSGAINISRDIYQNWINPDAGDRRVLIVSRLSVGCMAAIGLLVALAIEDIIAIYQVALSFTASALFFPVLAAVFWRRATKVGVIVSMLGAVTAALLWRSLGVPFDIHEIAPGLVTSGVLLVAASLMTRHSEDEHVVAYFYEVRDKRVAEEPTRA